MRVATKWVFDQGLDSMQRQQQQLVRTQQQLSTGQKLLAPSDDPAAAAQVLRTTQTQATGQQYARNQDEARNHLQVTESTLSGIGNLYQAARTTLVQAGDTTLSDSDRAAIAKTLESQYQQLLGLANATDGSGAYLFGGNRETSAPYAATAGGATYNGDQGQRQLQVSASRTIAVGDNGFNLFERVPTGNGVFSTAAQPGNTGSAVASPGSVTDPSALTGHSYSIAFNVIAGSTTYNVVDNNTGSAVSSGNPYVSGTDINFAGMRVAVQGTPAAGDFFVVAPSTGQSVFAMMRNAINALQTPITTGAQRAQLSMNMAQGIAAMDNAAAQLSSVHTTVGASLAELDTLGSANSDLNLAYTQQLSKLQDVDYTKAISDLNAGQLSLQAAQQSYAKVTKLTLFDFL